MLGALTPVIPLGVDPIQVIDLAAFAPDDMTAVIASLQAQQQTGIPFVDHADAQPTNAVQDWDRYIGQEPLKRKMRRAIADANARCAPLAHTLLATGMPGAGKTTLARLIAKTLDVNIRVLVPPFDVETLYQACQAMDDWDILFIDEIHALDRKMQDCLLTAMEEGRIYVDGQCIVLADFTFIGATTDADMLAEAVMSRFSIRPDTGAYFVDYTDEDCANIARNFASPDNLNVPLDDEVFVAIGKAAQGTPRICRDMVVAARMILNDEGYCTGQMVLDDMGVEPDGLSMQHKKYITDLYKFGVRRDKDGNIKYVMGQKTLETKLRLPSAGVLRMERLLIDRGLVVKESIGRVLTEQGIARAQSFVARGQSQDDA